jgi:putative peptidoglycan lipid II flippase
VGNRAKIGLTEMSATSMLRHQLTVEIAGREQEGPGRVQHVTQNLRIISGCTVVSRVLGMVRDAAMAATFGAGPLLDAFTLAFRLPNLARAVLGEGAVATALLPVLVQEREQHGQLAANRLLTRLIVWLAVLMGGLVALAEGGLWWWGKVAPLSFEGEQLRRLTALLLPYLILICLSAQVSAGFHAARAFLWPALIPIVLNLTWLLSLWLIVPWWSDPVAQMGVMSLCVVAAGALQLLLPLPALYRLGFRWAWSGPRTHQHVLTVLRHVTPVLGGLLITQCNALFGAVVAWGFSRPESGAEGIVWLGNVPYPLSAGTTAALYFGQRLYQFPLGVFGVALGTVLYPLLSAHAQRGDWDRLRADYGLGLRLVIAIGIPASAGLILLSEPLAAGCFEYGRFDRQATRQTAEMIAAYGVAVWAFCGLILVQRAFYALNDRLTPLRIGLIAVAINVLLSVTLIWWLGGAGLAWASSLAGIYQCVATGRRLQRRLRALGGHQEQPSVLVTLGKTAVATGVMYVAGLLVLSILPNEPSGLALVFRALRLLAPLGVGLATFLAVAALLRLSEPWELLRRRRRLSAEVPAISEV